MTKKIFSAARQIVPMILAAAVLAAAIPDVAAQSGTWVIRKDGEPRRERLHFNSERDGRSRGWLGIYLEDSAGDGVSIVRVVDGSPAAEAGLRSGDVIVEVNGRRVDGHGAFMNEFEGLTPGDRADLVVLRDGNEVSLSAELSERSRSFFPRMRFSAGDHHDDHEHGTPEIRKRGYLGVELKELTSELQEFFGAPEGAGILVSRVVEDSPADLAGIRVGDVIVEVDGREIERHGDLAASLTEKRQGDSVGVVVYRDGRPVNLDVTAGEREQRVWEVSRLFSCDEDEDEDCTNSFQFGFSGLEGLKGLQALEGLQGLKGDFVFEGLDSLHELFESGELHELMEGFHENHFRFQNRMENWQEQLQQHLEELEEKLRQRKLDDEDGEQTSFPRRRAGAASRT